MDVHSTRPSPAAIELLVLQPTPFCNLDCSYCYLPHRDSRRRMSTETVARAVECVFSSGLCSDHLKILWHAGEPLALPIAYYDAAFRTIEKARPGHIRVTHSLQTNGTLLSDRWTAFLKQWDVRIGLSLDGPRALHDAHRRTRAGRGTYDAAMRGLRRLQENRLAFDVITVLTEDTLDHADELFEFYRVNGIASVGFNVEEIMGIHRDSTISTDVRAAAAKRFLARFLALCRQDPDAPKVREFDEAVAAILQGGEVTNQATEAVRILTIDADGRMSAFSPELIGMRNADFGNFVFGTVQDDTVQDLLKHRQFQDLQRTIQLGVEACRAQCPYFTLCGGGAPANKFFECGRFDATETMACRIGRQAIIDVTLESLESLGPSVHEMSVP